MNKYLVTCPALPPYEEYIKEIASIWETKQLTNAGPKHAELSKQLEDFFNVPYVSLFANGHLALEIAIEALELTGEIITTPFTFASTTQAILRNGLKPVFCDVNPEDYTIDVNRIEELITDKTSAILPVHVYGNPCEVDKIEAIARKHNLKVIYDAAHAFGVKVSDKTIGQYGDMSMFSFHATKVYNTVEGGCVTYNEEKYRERFRSLMQFGQILKTDDYPLMGTNAKMTEMHAAMGICNLRHLDEYIQKRKQVVMNYRELLKGIEGIELCEEKEGVEYNYSYFPILFDNRILKKSRDQILDSMADNGVFARKYFYPLTCDFEIYKKMYGEEIVNVPVARRLANQVATLPLYPDLSKHDVEKICDVIKKVIR